MIRPVQVYLILIAFVILSGCSTEPADKETITKDADFRATIKTGDFVRLSEGYTYFEYKNKDADTLLVMVHGFSVPSYIWDSTYNAAIARGYGALRYDEYGRGYSDNPNVAYDAALYSNQLRELLASLKIEKKINLMGLSYGGRIITAFAFQYPERIQNLIYVDPAGFETIPASEDYPAMVTDDEINEFKKSDNYKNMAIGQLGDFYDPTPYAGWDKQYEEMMRFNGFVRALISTRKNSPSMENEHKKIADSGIQVFVFWGEHDTVVKLEEVKANLMERIPKVTLFVLPKAGHLPHMEQTSMFNSILFDQIICCEHR